MKSGYITSNGKRAQGSVGWAVLFVVFILDVDKKLIEYRIWALPIHTLSDPYRLQSDLPLHRNNGM